MIPLYVANRLRWINSGALGKYTRIVEYFLTLKSRIQNTEIDYQLLLDVADMHVKLGEPLQALYLLRQSPLNDSNTLVKKRILQSYALRSMRMTDAAAYLLFRTPQTRDDYELCLELARINFFLAVNARNSQHFRHDIEAAASTLKHCIRLNPYRPEAYVLYAHIAAPYDEWADLSDRCYHQFEELISQSAQEMLSLQVLHDAFSTNWLRGRTAKARQWLERWQQCLEVSPWLGDRVAFQQLGMAFWNLGKSDLYEECLQIVFLMYPSKAGRLVQFYGRRLRLARLFQIFRLGFRYTDLREYRWRLMLSRARGVAKKNVLSALIREPL